MADGRTLLFLPRARSSAEAYLRTSPPRGHSMVGVPTRCEGFVAIWLRASEDIVMYSTKVVCKLRSTEIKKSTLCAKEELMYKLHV